MFDLSEYLHDFALPAWQPWAGMTPWALVADAPGQVAAWLAMLSPHDYRIADGQAIHRTATVEPGALLKGPLVVGPGCFIAAGALLRGGCWLGEGCIIGPGAELKTSFVFAGSKLAHFNFVGDSVLGRDVNLEAGSIVCNYRNERADKQVRVRLRGALVATGSDKFGALIGDGARLGANAVLAPGALLARGTVIGRAALYDAEAL